MQYDSDDEEKERALKEANTRVAREREYSNKIMNPEDAKAGGVEDKFIPEADLDRLLLEGEEENAGGGAANGVKAAEAAAAAAAAKPKKRVQVAQREMPPPRAAVSVAIEFTKLETDHMPARANREKEIREWKREQRGKVGRCKLKPC